MLYSDGELWASIEAFGKQPLPFWLFGTFGNILSNPLTGGRLVTFLISIPLFFVLYEIVLLLFSDKRVAKLALIIFSTTPLFILFQSLAIMDGFLLSAAGGIFLLLVRKKKDSLSNSLYLGLLIGLALWVKNNAVVIAFLALTTYLVLLVSTYRKNLVEIIMRCGLCIGVVFICLLPLIVRADFHRLLGESNQFTFTISELFELPFEAWFHNTLYVLVSFLFYFGPIFLISFIFGLMKTGVNKKMLLVWWFLVPTVLSIITVKTFTIRYFLFGSFFLVPLAAFGLGKKVVLLRLVTALFIIQGGIFVVFPYVYFGLIPQKSLIERERHYAFTNGFGTWKVTAFIRDNLPRDKYVYIAVEDRQGNPSDYILAYFYYSPHVRPFFLSTENELRDIKKIFGTQPLYYVARGSAVPEDLKPYLKSLRTYDDPDRSDFVGLYQVDMSM